MTRDQLRMSERVIKARYRALRTGISIAKDARYEKLEVIPLPESRYRSGRDPSGDRLKDWKENIEGLTVPSKITKAGEAYFQGLEKLSSDRTAMLNKHAQEDDDRAEKEQQHEDKFYDLVREENTRRNRLCSDLDSIKNRASRELEVAEDEHVVRLHMDGDGEMRDFITSLPTAIEVSKALRLAGFTPLEEIQTGRLLGAGESP